MSGSFLSMSSLEVTRILKALPATDDELRIVLEKKRRRQKFPITMEMSAVTRQLHWTEQLRTWTMAKSLDLMGAALGMSLQVEATSRGTNWVGPRAIKTQDLRFQVGVGKRQDNGSYEAAREVRGHLLTNIICEDFIEDDDTAPVIDFDRVLMVNMDHLQTKPGKPVEDIRVARRTDEESQILNDIITRLALANPQQGEPFLTRRGHHITSAGNTRRDIKKIITGAMVTNMMKDTAVRLGLNPELFSLSSLRKTGVTNMSKKGADIETINDRTGHQPGSIISRQCYDFAHGNRSTHEGPAALTGNGWTNEDLAKLVPQSRLAPEKTATTRRSSRKGKGQHLYQHTQKPY